MVSITSITLFIRHFMTIRTFYKRDIIHPEHHAWRRHHENASKEKAQYHHCSRSFV